MELKAMDGILLMRTIPEDEALCRQIDALGHEVDTLIKAMGGPLGLEKGMTPGTVATGVIACRILERMLVASIGRVDTELVKTLDGMTDLLEGQFQITSAIIPRPRQL